MRLRWEWRTFDQSFGDLETRLAAAAQSTRSSDEWYVLGAHSCTNVKVREGTLDVKSLERVNADGLQLWRPTLKAAFPVDAGTVRAVAQLLAAPAPILHRDHYSVEAWLTEVIARAADVAAVRVRKNRHGSVVGSCLVELAFLVVDGTPVTTVAIESEDPSAVIDTVRALDLADRSNEDYVTALKRLAVHQFSSAGAAPWRALP